MSAGDAARRRYGLDLDRIDRYLAGLADVTTDTELRHHFGSYHADYAATMPDDPFSPAYRKCVLDMYAHLSGRSYAPTNEITQFDAEAAVTRPFPYFTRSATVTGEHLMLLGQLVRVLEDLPPGASVLDCGAGWGNSTIEFAKVGFRVTALEVEPRFVQLIEARAARAGVDVELVTGDFLTVFEELAASGRTFDAVVFFESFHHCDDPVRLVSLIDRIMAPGGLTVFASEPISDGFPVPWGLRLDGESLWAIRSNGWLELGFQTGFFDQLLRRNGWLSWRWNLVPSLHAGTAHVARRSHEARTEWTPTSGLRSLVGTSSPTGISASGRPGFLVFGPYTALASGPWRFVVHVDATGEAPSGSVAVDISIDESRRTLARRRFEARRDTSVFEVEAEVPDGVHDLEVRVAVAASTRLRVTRVEAIRLDVPVVNRVERGGRERAIAAALLVRRVPVVGRLIDRAARDVVRWATRRG